MSTKDNKEFLKSYNDTASMLGASVATAEIREYGNEVNRQIEKLTSELNTTAEIYKNAHPSQLAGRLADQWHNKTLKYSAQNKGMEYEDLRRSENHTGDIDALINKERIQAEAKYYADEIKTLRALSDPKYDGMIKIGPSDQAVLGNFESSVKVNDWITSARSKPLSSAESFELAGSLSSGEGIPEHISNKLYEFDTALIDGLEGGAYGALMAAAIKATPLLYEAIHKSLKHNRFEKELFLRAGLNSVEAAKRSGLIATLTGTVTAMSRAGLFGEALMGADPSLIAGIVLFSIKSITSTQNLINGKITIGEYAQNLTIAGIGVSGTVTGAIIGQSLIPVPVLGALIGAVVGGVVAQGVIYGGKFILSIFGFANGIPLIAPVKFNFSIPSEDFEKLGLRLLAVRELSLETTKLKTLNIREPKIRQPIMHLRRNANGVLELKIKNTMPQETPAIIIVAPPGDFDNARKLRDTISKNYNIEAALWNVKRYYENEHKLTFFNPIISLGKADVNKLTGYLNNSITEVKYDDNEFQIKMDTNRASIWGKGTTELTLKGVDTFIERYLEEWLEGRRLGE